MTELKENEEITLTEPFVLKVPDTINDINGEKNINIFEKNLKEEIKNRGFNSKFIEKFPVVYIHTWIKSTWENKKTGETGNTYGVYIGETNDIIQRTGQHYDNKDKFVKNKKHYWSYNIDENNKDSKNKNVCVGGSTYAFIMGHEHFNKSLTLDIENRFIHYLNCVRSIKEITNGRGNYQKEYYPENEFDPIFDKLWNQLHSIDDKIFPDRKALEDSAIFKCSPFIKLDAEQEKCKEEILKIIRTTLKEAKETNTNKLILVEGEAGTGKTVLMSSIFNELLKENDDYDEEDLLNANEIINNAVETTEVVIKEDTKVESKENDNEYIDEVDVESIEEIEEEYTEETDEEIDEDNVEKEDETTDENEEVEKYALIVNHKEQEKTYRQIFTQLNHPKAVFGPTNFLNKYSIDETITHKKDGKTTTTTIKRFPMERAVDVAFVDEAHLLYTQPQQSYIGDFEYKKNKKTNKLEKVYLNGKDNNSQRQLDDIRKRAKVTVAMIDTHQILRRDEFFDPDYIKDLVKSDENTHLFPLENQKRMCIKNEDAKIWHDKFKNGILSMMPQVNYPDDYDIKIFENPKDLYNAIKEKSEDPNSKLSRLIASYDWEYKNGKDASKNMYNVTIHLNDETGEVWSLPWNYEREKKDKTIFNNKEYLSEIKEQAWAEQEHTIDEVGSTYTIQGYDLHYPGVILGKSITLQKDADGNYIKDKDGNLLLDFLPNKSKNDKASKFRTGYSQENRDKFLKQLIKNEFYVLSTRGVKGLYIYACDDDLRNELLRLQKESIEKNKEMQNTIISKIETPKEDDVDENAKKELKRNYLNSLEIKDLLKLVYSVFNVNIDKDIREDIDTSRLKQILIECLMTSELDI